jgi:4,5-dihydroxyphthalate decarboxylase
MPNVPIHFACGLYDRMLALYTGEVKPEGIDLRYSIEENPRAIFDRMGGELAFDACEMSSSEFVTRLAAKQCPMVAIPVFPSRIFRHGYIIINRRSGIRHPKDLEGKRVGVPLYTVSALVYMRGMLEHEYGVDLSTIRWVQGDMASAKPVHGNPSVMPLVKPVAIELNNSGKSLNELLEANEISAVMAAFLPQSFGRNPDIVRLFPDYRAVEEAYYQKTGIFPIMHLVAIRRDLYERHPFVAASLYRAFCRSRELALERLLGRGASFAMLPWLKSDTEKMIALFGGDLWPYGIEPNRKTLDAFVTYLAEQAMIAAKMPIEALFVPV